jgi:hypothetical protein
MVRRAAAAAAPSAPMPSRTSLSPPPAAGPAAPAAPAAAAPGASAPTAAPAAELLQIRRDLDGIRSDLNALRLSTENDRARSVQLALTLDHEFAEMRAVNDEVDEMLRVIQDRAAADSRQLSEALADIVERERNRRRRRVCTVM